MAMLNNQMVTARERTMTKSPNTGSIPRFSHSSHERTNPPRVMAPPSYSFVATQNKTEVYHDDHLPSTLEIQIINHSLARRISLQIPSVCLLKPQLSFSLWEVA